MKYTYMTSYFTKFAPNLLKHTSEKYFGLHEKCPLSFYSNKQCTKYIFYFNNIYFIITATCFDTLTDVFPCFFLSCKANARVKPAKTGRGLHSF